MTGAVVKNANAKINLTLDLTCTLPDGYHAIHTVMQSVTLHDTVAVSPAASGIELRCSDPALPGGEENLAAVAARLFYEAAGLSPAVRIDLTKRIPSRAGLGGGSADAAAVLAILNEMHGFCLSDDILLKIALKIGSDVPFCLVGGTMACFNKGEVMAKIEPFSSFVLVAKPELGISTREAFAKFDSAPPLRHPDTDAVLYCLMRGEQRSAFERAGNLFEQLCPLKQGAAIKNTMRENGAFYAAMSGSGSAFFGLFNDRAAAENAAAALTAAGVPFVNVCRTAERGIE